MTAKELNEIKQKVDNILDTYFEEFCTRFEEKKDVQGLMGWLRMSIHDAVSRGHVSEEAQRSRYIYHAAIALLIISLLDLILTSLRYVFDPI